ncbi:sulfatase [Nocardioides sp.]|uniref:sulfatase family protein n=1 Tax=Nocardioides sp. TaxID=35761 RepID=UPI0025E304D6|nr:sulfatase [Nocardioides sp.]
MNRPRILAGAVLVALVLSSVATVVLARTESADGPAVPRAQVSDRPNIVLISTDDQALMEMRWMPQTRRLLGGQGATFRNFVAPQPLCCPARAQILTGQYAQNNGVLNNAGPHGGVEAFEPAEATALPVWLQNAGYRTGFAGKYLNSYNERYGVPPGWDEWDATVDGIFDYYGFEQYDGTTLTHPPGHQSDYLAQSTADFITRSAEDPRPFFVWTSYSAPHGTCINDTEGNCSAPPIPAHRDEARYAGVEAPFADSPGVKEKDLRDKPAWVTDQGPVEPETMQRLFTQRIRSLASVDDAVATTVSALKEAGELDNTLILFTSDNGYLFGEHGYTGKIVAYEESLRVPLLMRGPGIPAGVVRRQVASMTDLAPTFAAIAHANPLVKVDGRSMLPWARRDRRQTDRTLLVQAGWRGRNPDHHRWLFRGVRTDRYTLIDWRTEDLVELYDRRRDPAELHNVGERPRYAAVRTALVRRTHLLSDCAGRSCRMKFSDLPAPPTVRRPAS